MMRQSSTVSGGEAKNGSSALQVLKAAAARAEKWKAEAAAGARLAFSHQSSIPLCLLPFAHVHI